MDKIAFVEIFSLNMDSHKLNSNESVDDLKGALLDACEAILAEIRQLQSSEPGPTVIALDGGSGAGKSTLADLVAQELGAVLIPLDDFFSADIPDDRWDRFSVKDRLKYVFDWVRLRQTAIEPLLRGKPARWHAFDFVSGLRPDGTYGMLTEPTEQRPAEVILLEGAYAASPPLADLVNLAILADVPVSVRHARLASRENEDFMKVWHRRWDPVEDYYFSRVRPKNSFDLVVRLG